MPLVEDIYYNLINDLNKNKSAIFMRLTEKLTQKTIDNLFNLYKEVSGSVENKYPNVNEVMSCLNANGFFEYCAGSRWSGDSKFIITTSDVHFYPNYEPKDNKVKGEIDNARIQFEKKVVDYFNSIKA